MKHHIRFKKGPTVFRDGLIAYGNWFSIEEEAKKALELAEESGEVTIVFPYTVRNQCLELEAQRGESVEALSQRMQDVLEGAFRNFFCAPLGTKATNNVSQSC